MVGATHYFSCLCCVGFFCACTLKGVVGCIALGRLVQSLGGERPLAQADSRWGLRMTAA